MLGYRRDLTATTLRRADRASASIGLVFDDVANPFHAAAAPRRRGRRARARRARRSPAAPTRTPTRERELVEAFLLAPRRRPDHRARRAATTATCGATATPAWRWCSSTARRATSTPTACSPTTRAAPPAATAHLIAARPPADRLPRRPAADLTPPPSACAATARRSPRTASPTTRRSCAWSWRTARRRAAATASCSRGRPPDRDLQPRRTSSLSARCSAARARPAALDRARRLRRPDAGRRARARASRWSRRTRRARARRRPSSCSRGSTATPAPTRRVDVPTTLIRAAAGVSLAR